jgi:hypothetical protein
MHSTGGKAKNHAAKALPLRIAPVVRVTNWALKSSINSGPGGFHHLNSTAQGKMSAIDN